MSLTVTVRSCLPLGNPQGEFSQTVSEDMTVGYFIRKVCRDSGIQMRSSLTLRNSEDKELRWSSTLREAYVISGAVLMLHDTEDDVDLQTKIMNCNVWWFIAAACLLVGVVGLVVINILHHKDREPDYSYGVVLDAGSSHTQLFVYQWDTNCPHETALAHQVHSCRVQGPGISSYEEDPPALRPHLQVCLQEAEGVVPDDKYRSTPVYLGATAGMRLIQAVNSSKSEIIMNVVRDTIGLSKFQFSHPKTQARILTGAEEGLFSWISVNYVTGKFGVIPPHEARRFKRGASEAGEGTVGALDMGGASTQITFYPGSFTLMPENYSENAVLYAKNYTVYTHSYLCYGINEIKRKYKAFLVQSQNFSSEVDDPCSPSGNAQVDHQADIFEAPCTKGTFEPPDKNKTFTLRGSGNDSQCTETIRQLFDFNQPCPYSGCSFNGTYQPLVHGQFYAFSNFFFEMDFLNQTNNSSLSEFQAALSTFCHMTWKQVKEKYPKTPTEYLPWYCFGGVYMHTLLVEGYKFDHNTWSNIHFVDKLRGTEIGWSLGFMIDSSSDLPITKREYYMTNLVFALMMTLFILFILISVGFACHAIKFQQRKRRGEMYQSALKSDGYGAIQ
ncbi:ectonucleoside triphosphate diphosphohydrolase 8-like [Crassostrea virginica]